MLEECHTIAPRRDAGVAAPGRGLWRVDLLSERKLEAPRPVDHADYGKRLAVRAPVGILHVLEDFPRGTSRQGYASKRSLLHAVEHAVQARVQENRHLPSGGNRQELGVRDEKPLADR